MSAARLTSSAFNLGSPSEDTEKNKKSKSKNKNKGSSSNSDLLELSGSGSEPKLTSSSSLLNRSGPDLAGGPDLETLIIHENQNISSDEAANKINNVPENDLPPPPVPVDYIRHWKRKYTQNYGYVSLFRYASPLDRIYLLFGTVAALIGGVCVPIMIYLFGNMVRTMVLVGQIEHSLDCKKYPNSRILGNQTDCKNFHHKCLKDKPFKGKLSKGGLNDVIFKSMQHFVLWHTIAAAVFTVCSSVYFICWHTAADNQIARIRKKYFEALLRKDMTWFDTQKDPNSVNKLMDHTRGIMQGIGDNIPIAINLIVIFICSLILAFSKGWELSLLGLVGVVVVISTTWLVSYTEARKMIAELRAYKAGNEFVEEILKNIKTVIFYGGQKKELLRYKKELSYGFRKVLKWIFAHSGCVFLHWLTNFVVWAVIFWYGIALAILAEDCKETSSYADYDAGDVVTILFSVIFGAGNIYLIIPVIQAMRVAKQYGRKVFKVIDVKSQIDALDTTGTSLDNNMLTGEIEFEDVRFTYPTRKDDVVLNHLNLHVLANSKVAIVGLNGCGKSSIIKLICKQYLPDSGFIRIDGIDIREISTKWLRSQIGVVPQESNLFDDTIEANVRTGKLDASFFEIQEACKSANAHNFIVSFKEAYQTRIGMHGFKLTTGQQQRIAIARALLRNPKILLLDEPTSSLDPESELMVMDTLNSIAKDRTVILVTHRLHAVTNADMIYVIKRGKVAEKGTHSKLIKNKGPYSQLASGNFDKPSTSVREIPKITAFDASDITAIHYMKLFATKPFMPNIYNDLLSVDPVAIQMSRLMMDDTVVSTKVVKRLYDFDDSEFFYILENKDSIAAGDAQLSKSESGFKDKPENIQVVKIKNDDTEVEGLKDLLNPYRYSYWQVLWLATSSSYKVPIIICLIASMFIGLTIPVFGILFAEVIALLSDASAIPGDWNFARKFGHNNYYLWVVVGLVLLGVVAGILAAIQDFALSIASYKMIKYVRKTLFSAYLKQDLAFFENPNNGISALRNLLVNNVMTLRYMLTGFYANIIQCLFGVSFAIILGAAIFASALTGYAVAIAVAVTVVNFTDGWLSKKQQLANVEALEKFSSLILEVFKGKHNVTIMQLEPFFLERFNEVQLAALRKRRRISYFRAFTFGWSQTAVFWGYSLLIYIGAREIVHHEITFVSVIAIGEMLLFGLMFLGFNLSVIPSFKVAVKAGEAILNVLHRQPDVSIFFGDDVEVCTGKLGFRDTHFWYPFAGDNPLLKGVTFTVSPGNTVAIVGSSESGKGVYLDIVMRLYDVTSGAIILDGRDIKELNILSLRRQIGYIEKEPQLFKRTVAENIAYGDNAHLVTMTEIIEAAKKTKMHNFICSLPDGYDTRIGGDNERLSSSQKQRIMIARALLRNPKILLVDESIASLDREGEKLVNESIDVACKDRTCIVIGHRLASIQKADLIIMMSDGYKREMGTHADLIKIPGGEYGKLWRSQNPLEDEGFSKGKSWAGKSTTRLSQSKPKLEEPKPYVPPPPEIESPPQPSEEPIPEIPKKGGGWMCNTLGD